MWDLKSVSKWSKSPLECSHLWYLTVKYDVVAFVEWWMECNCIWCLIKSSVTQEICNRPEASSARVYYLIRAVWAEESAENKPLIVHVEKQAQYSVKRSCTIQLGRVCHSSSCWITSALLSLICLVRPRCDWGAVVGRHKIVWNTHRGGKYSHWNIFSAYKKLLIYIKNTAVVVPATFQISSSDCGCFL